MQELTGLERNVRGLLRIGPQYVTPSDVLVKAMEQARLTLARDNTDSSFKANILEERRAQRITRGREAARLRGRRVRPWECVP